MSLESREHMPKEEQPADSFGAKLRAWRSSARSRKLLN